MKIPNIPLAKNGKQLDSEYKKGRASNTEFGYEISMVMKLVLVVIVSSVIMLVPVIIMDGLWTITDYLNNLFCNTLALIVVVMFMDTLVSHNKESRKRRDEARAILRHNRIIQPDIDMYIVRKNMVITPHGRTMRKFQVDSEFTINDMRDIYGPSELVSDVGISKIKRYDYYQRKLYHDFEKLIEAVDFNNYPEIFECVMKYINATAYGEAALEAVIGYEDAKSGTRSVRVMIVSMIKDEPENGRFMDADPMMKNVYLLHQMINDQEKAVSDYLRLIRTLESEDPDSIRIDTDYE